MKLTAPNIRTLSLPEDRRDVIHFDDALPGFGLRLRASGGRVVRSWICQFRVRGRSQRVLLGSADVLTPEQAKAAAKALLAKVALGHDPQAEKAAKRQQAARTFRSVVASYLEAKHPELRPVSNRLAKLYLAGPYFQPLHALAVTAVTRSDVAASVRAISRKHSTTTAAAARRALSAFFAWSIAEGVMGDCPNPVDGSYRPAASPPRQRVLDHVELAAIWHGVGEMGDYTSVIRLLICCGARREEIGAMKRSEISDDGASWVIPKERTKSKREHRLPITPLMKSIIDTVPVRAGSDHLFARKGFTAWSKCKRLLDEKLDLPPWRTHDIRRSVSTLMNDLGIAPPHIIEKILGHTLGGVHGIYNKSEYPTEVRSALLMWSEHVTALVEGRQDKIVALRA